MNTAGDAAEQVVRMSLQGVEVAARITGTAAKEIALLIITALKSDGKGHIKLKGKERLSAMLKSGKPLEIYSVKDRDLERFSKAAKEYGIVYCVLRSANNSPDGLCDVLVKADDAPKLARIIDRYNIGTVDRAKIERDISSSIVDKDTKALSTEVTARSESGQAVMDVGDTEKLIDDLLGTAEGKAPPDIPLPQKEQERETTQPKTPTDKAEPQKEESDTRPLADGGTENKSNQSVPTSEHSLNSERDILSKAQPHLEEAADDISHPSTDSPTNSSDTIPN